MSVCETNIKNSLIAKATQFFKENNSEITVMPIDRIQEQENVKARLNNEFVNLFEVDNISSAIDNLKSKQKHDLEIVLNNVSNNISRRLGIDRESYRNRIKIYKTNKRIPNKHSDFWTKTFSDFNEPIGILFQPNQEYENKRKNNPKIKKYELDESSESDWLIKYIEQGRISKNLLQLNTKEEINKALLEEFETLGEEIKLSDEFVVGDLSDEFIDKQLSLLLKDENGNYVETEIAREWKAIKRDRSLLENKRKEQRSVDLDNYTYLKYNNYPIGLKVLLLENLLYNSPSYDQETDNFKKGTRDKYTLKTAILLDGLFVSELQKIGAKSSVNVLNDYLWGAAHFEGIKIDVEKYKNNVHKTTENGIWYKFKGEEDLEKFKEMSALSATTAGRWCTGSDMKAREYLIENDSTIYIFYDTKYTNNVSLQVAVYNSNNTVYEIGGTLKGQDLKEQENNEFDSFLNDNKDINAGVFLNYIDYKKAMQKWVNNNNDIDSLDYDDWLKIYNGKQYYKDQSNLLETLKNKIPTSFYATLYNVDEKHIHIGDINESNVNIINDKNIKLIIGNISLDNGAKLTVDSLETVKGHIYLSGNVTLTANSLETVGEISLGLNATLIVDSLKTVAGIDLDEGARLTANSLKTVNDGISLSAGVILTANLLETVNYISLREGAILTTNLLETVNYISLSEGSTLTANSLETVRAITLSKKAKLTTDSLKTVNGKIYLAEGSTLTAKSLKTVDSSEAVNRIIYLEKNATLTANLLETVVSDILLDKGATLNVDSLKTVDGKILLFNGATLTVNSLKTVSGEINLSAGAKLIVDSLEAVDDNISLGNGSTLTAYSLKTVDNISLGNGSTLTANSLEAVSNIYLAEGSALTANSLEAVNGNIYLHEGSTVTANLLETVDGRITLYQNAKLIVDSLKTVGGGIDLKEGSTLTANSLEAVHGDIILYKKAKLTTNLLEGVNGRIYLVEGSTLTAKSLKTVTGGITIEKDAKIIVDSKVYNNSNIDKLKLKRLSNKNTQHKGNKAAILKTKNTNYFIFGKDSNLTSAIHEKTHEYEDVLTEDEIEKLEKWSGYKKGSKAFSEAFAVGAERYIYEGYLADDEKLGGIFKRFVEWFKELIEDAISYFGSINELNDEVKEIYARMFIEQTVDKTVSNTESTLSNSNQIKQGVVELFESNPKLANAVYEALGLNIINESEITYTDEEGNPCAKMGLTNTVKGTDWNIVKDFKGKPKHSNGGVDITISDKGVSMRRGGKDIKAQYGLLIPAQNLSISNPDNPPFDEWYKTVPKEKNDTTNYNLRRAYELAPKEQLDEFVKNPDAHLYSVYKNPKTGEYEFMKSKNHPTLKYEIDWYNSEEGKEFRNNYDLDMTNEYYKYIPKIKK